MQENSETTKDRPLDEELADVLDRHQRDREASRQKAADGKSGRRNAEWGK